VGPPSALAPLNPTVLNGATPGPVPGVGPKLFRNAGTVQLLSFVAIVAGPPASALVEKICATQTSNGERYRLNMSTSRPSYPSRTWTFSALPSLVVLTIESSAPKPALTV